MANYTLEASQIIRLAKNTKVLDEHAKFLTALTEIDELLLKLLTAETADVPLLIQQMRDTMPPSIVVTRKEKVE